MKKTDILKEIIAILSSKNIEDIKGNVVVDCLKEIILLLDKDADVRKCYTIVDCLNMINAIKEKTNVDSMSEKTKVDCLNRMIKIYNNDYIDNKCTVADCIAELANAISGKNFKDSQTISEALLNLKDAIANESTHTHNYVAQTSNYSSNGPSGHEVSTTMICECGDNRIDTNIEEHVIIDEGTRSGIYQPVKCEQNCGYTSRRALSKDELDNYPNSDHVHRFILDKSSFVYANKDDTSHEITITYKCECGSTYNDTITEEHDMIDYGDRIGINQPTKCSHNCGYTSYRVLSPEELKETLSAENNGE